MRRGTERREKERRGRAEQAYKEVLGRVSGKDLESMSEGKMG